MRRQQQRSVERFAVEHSSRDYTYSSPLDTRDASECKIYHVEGLAQYVEPAIGNSDRSTLIVADRVMTPHNIMRYRLDESDKNRQTGTVSMIYLAYNVETQDKCQMNAPDKLRYTRLSIENIEPSESR